MRRRACRAGRRLEHELRPVGCALTAISALRHPHYRWLWSSSLLSWAGQWIQQASLGWVVYEITGSGTLLGTVLSVRAIPMLALTPLSGVAADRYAKRRLLLASQVFAAAVCLAFGMALALGLVEVWLLFAFTVLMGASSVMDRPARLTSAFELVPREDQVGAVAINTVGFSLMRLLGPAAAGYLIAVLGAAGAFFAQALLYAASGALVLAIAFPPRRPPAVERPAFAEMKEGMRFAVRNPDIRSLVLVGALPYLLVVPVIATLYPILAKDVFGSGPQGLGMLLAAVGLGGALGGFVAGALSSIPRQGLLQVAWIVVFAGAMAGVGLSPGMPWALSFSVVGGLAEMAHTASNMAMLQMSAPEGMRGRIAAFTMLYPAFISVGAIVAGALADLFGARGACAGLAAAATAGAILLCLLSPHLRRLELK